ncbi:hypothetical protein V6N12_009954 [Hibiscus sabdariffa]|uniref:Uncharacterized protein n=1 Tax=Hibiscus sabdariffa TaxID=183260 RepID=A0ABR2ECP1_9ROSI
MENRLDLVEASNEENMGYLQRILNLLSKEVDDMEENSPGITPKTTSTPQLYDTANLKLLQTPTTTATQPIMKWTLALILY